MRSPTFKQFIVLSVFGTEFNNNDQPKGIVLSKFLNFFLFSAR